MPASARNTFFEKDKKITVEQYFKITYNITLQYPTDLPVIKLGTNKEATLVPAELCIVEPGNPYRGRLPPTEMVFMSRCACDRPRDNAESIVNIGFPSLGLSPAVDPLAGFGITIDKEMAVIPGRELPPPGLNYKAGIPRVANGFWNVLGVKFYKGAKVPSCGPTDPLPTGLIYGFANKLRKSGMAVPDRQPPIRAINLFSPSQDDGVRSRSVGVIRKVLKAPKKPEFILILLENRDNYIYPVIKKIGGMELGTYTLCMQLDKPLERLKKQYQYFSNVALKLNAKLGGVNHQTNGRWNDSGRNPPRCMMVGIDVTHTGPNSRIGTPSIAAVVANTDDTFVQFPASMRIQAVDPSKEFKEMVDELRDMMIERLLVYERKAGKLPQRVFIFRDGISEGQIDITLREELLRVLDAFQEDGDAEEAET